MRALYLLPLLSLPLLVACPEQEVKEDTGETETTDTGPDLTREMEVTVDGSSYTVNLYDLATVTYEGDDVVAATAVLEATELDTDFSVRTFDFVASDGFSPSSRDCEPVDYTVLESAFFYRESGNLVWDLALNIAGCYWVDDTVTVAVQDAE